MDKRINGIFMAFKDMVKDQDKSFSEIENRCVKDVNLCRIKLLFY